MNAKAPAKGARGGHPRTVPYSKMSSKGRTELQIRLSRAKSVKEAAGDIHFCVFPQKTSENAEKPFFSSNLFEIFRKCPNASKRIQMHPNASERIRMHSNRSEQVRANPKTSKTRENLEKFAKNSQKFSRTLVFGIFSSLAVAAAAQVRVAAAQARVVAQVHSSNRSSGLQLQPD